MKKIFTFALFLTAGLGASAAQGSQVSELGSTETLLFTLNAVAILLVIYIASSFLLSLVRLFLGDRLRRSLLDKNASEEVIGKVLPATNSMRQTALKWCCLLIAAGTGLTICYYSLPVGLHSAIIMSFSLAAGLLAYFLISKPRRAGS